MKNFLTATAFALALFLSATGAAPVAHAGTVPAGGVCTKDDDCTTGHVCSNTLTKKCVSEAVDEKVAGIVGVSTSDTSNPDPSNKKDKPLDWKDPEGLFATVMIRVMTLFAWLLGVAILTFDNAVYYTVLTMGEWVKGLGAIGDVWSIFRDIGNIIIIFGFLAIGIAVILNIEEYGYKKLLPKLLIAAVFLNFSMFISMAVIDVGNLFAVQFYKQINGGQLPTEAGTALKASINAPSKEAISSAIMNQLGLATVYGNARTNSRLLQGSNPILIGFMGTILFIVTAFVMFSLAFILIARFIVLIFVIMLSPLGFAGYAMPKLQFLSKQWQDALIKQTITAPVLFLLLYVALRVITGNNFLIFKGVPDATGFVTGGGAIENFGGFILSFIVAIGLLLAVVVASKKMGAAGASLASSTAGKLSFGATAWAARTVGGGASRAAAQKMRTADPESKAGRFFKDSRLGRGLIKTAEYGAKSSFDIRGSKAWGALGDTPLGGIDAGKPQTGGYEAARAANIKAYEAFVKKTDETIDERELMRDPTDADKRRVGEVQAAHAAAEATHAAAQDEKNRLDDAHKKNLAKVQSIEAEKPANPREQANKEERLKVARANVAASGSALATATSNTAGLKKALEVAKEKKDKIKDAKAAQAARAGEEKKQQKLAYADSIKTMAGLLSGKGSLYAAAKIKKAALETKSKKDKLLEGITELAKEGEKKEEESKGEANPDAENKPTESH